MQNASGPANNEIVLRLDLKMPIEQALNFQGAANLLTHCVRASNDTPYHWTYIDKPMEGEMHAIFQTPSLPAFTVDGLYYLEQEQTYKVPLGAYELEVAETKYGFVPGAGEPQATRMRRKMRFTRGAVPAVVLVHYSRGPARPIPMSIANQPVRRYPLIPSTEPGIFVMGDKTAKKVPPPGMIHQQGMNGAPGFGGPPPQGPMMGQPMGVQQQQGIHAQNAAIAAQNAAMGAASRGQPPKQTPPFEEDGEDESDVVTYRDLATTRFIRNHEFLAELFSPEPIPPAFEQVKQDPEELEQTLVKLKKDIEAQEAKNIELASMKADGSPTAVTV